VRRAPALVLLCALAAAGEAWEDLEREWIDALDAWEKGPHPFEKFQDRFRRFVQEHGNAPEALPAVLVLVRHTTDANELHRLVVHLRETYVRYEEIGGSVPAIVRMGGPEARRTLKDFIEQSPHAAVQARARRGLRELTELAVGMAAPETSGEDAAGATVRLSDRRGEVVLLVFGEGPWTKEVALLHRRKKVAVLGVGTGESPWPVWTDTERIAGSWNALDESRLYVIDRKGVIRGKDVSGKPLEDLVRALLEEAK
jgi:hypothetical protein